MGAIYSSPLSPSRGIRGAVVAGGSARPIPCPLPRPSACSRPAVLLNKDEKLKIELQQGWRNQDTLPRAGNHTGSLASICTRGEESLSPAPLVVPPETGGERPQTGAGQRCPNGGGRDQGGC